MMDKPVLSIIIVHWNTPELLSDCLKSLIEYEKELSYEVIVVDNNSTRGITEAEQEFSSENFKFIRLKENIGFGRACNFGAELAAADTLLFLGPDTKLISYNSILNTYLKFKSITNAGAFSCSLLNSDGSPQKHFFNFPSAKKIIWEWWWETTNHIPAVFKKRQKQPPKLLEEVDMLIAHYLMVSKKVFNDVRGFPEEAFMFGDDIEINKRIQKKGYHNYLYKGEHLIHHSGQGGVVSRYGDKRIHIIQDSIFKFNCRHHNLFYAVFVTMLLVLRAFCNILLLSPLYITKKSFKEYFFSNWMIIWHYLAFQWRPMATKKISGELPL